MPMSPAVATAGQGQGQGRGLARNDSVGSLAALAAQGHHHNKALVEDELVSVAVGPAHRAVRVTEVSLALVLSGAALSSVDLSPLQALVKPKRDHAAPNGPALREISLASNCFKTVDLTPLAALSSLAVLTLNNNALAGVNLAPLAHCPSLERLWLHKNALTFIDLAPLQSCPLLRSLYLDSNRIDQVTVDLQPLAHCRLLRSLRLTGNKLNGVLDLTPLLTCSNLSAFDVASSVKLVADATGSSGNGKSPASLPPAIRKRHEAVQWRNSQSPPHSPTEKKLRAEPVSKPPGLPFEALLLNFGMSDFYKARDLLSKQGNISSTGVADVLYERDGLHRYHIALVHITDQATAERAVQEIIAIRKELPVVVIGPSTVADIGSACIRRGAKRFFAQPLGARDAISIRNLAYRDHQDEKENELEVPKSVGPTKIAPLQSKPATKLVVPALKRLRPIAPQRSGVGSPARNKMERSALDKLFVRSGGAVDVKHFTPMATLSGLPSCASEMLFQTCARYAKVDPTTSMTKESFAAFWEDRLQHRDAEGRLFEVMLSHDDGRFVHPVAFYTLAETLLKSVKNRLPDMPLMQGAITSGILYGLTGQASPRRPVLEREMRKAAFCSRLLACESGVYEGFIAFMRPDRFSQIYSVFRTARANALRAPPGSARQTKVELGPDQMIDFCKERGLLFPRAVKSLFSHQIWTADEGQPGLANQTIPFPDFLVAWLAMSEASSRPATDYWFSVLDFDKDGHLSAFDAAHFFVEKDNLLKDDGLVLAPFWEVWTCILDICAPRDPRLGPTLVEFKALSEKNRDFIIKALLFREDGNIIIDIRKTMEAGEGCAMTAS